MYLCDVGEEPGPHLFQVSFRFFFFSVINVWKNNNNDISVDPLSWVSKGKKRAAEDNKISEKQRDVGWCASLLRVDNTDKISLVTASPRRLYYYIL